MRAIVAHAAKDLRVEEASVPALGPEDIRVRIAFGGICGSDLHYYNHGGFGAVRLREPMILGHEIAGVVEAVGAEARLRSRSATASPSTRAGRAIVAATASKAFRTSASTCVSTAARCAFRMSRARSASFWSAAKARRIGSPTS